jgi:CRP-like cAMP-binding protein
MVAGHTPRRRRQMASFADAPVRNRILAALLATEYKALLPKLEHVALTRGQVIYRADQDIEEVYFPEEAVVAMVDSMDDGRTVEVGLIGREGIVGINIVLGGVATPVIPARLLTLLGEGSVARATAKLLDFVRQESPSAGGLDARHIALELRPSEPSRNFQFRQAGK